MSTTTQAAAEIQALAEKLVLAQKELDKASAATRAVTKDTQAYSTAVHAAALVQEQKAAAAAQAAADALDEYKEAAKGATTSTQELSRLFAKAFGEEVPEKIGDTKKAFVAFADSSKTATERTKGLFAGIGLGASAVRAGAVGMLAYAQQILAVGQASLEAKVRSEQLQEQTNAVAHAMSAVERATGGAGTEQDAFAVRTALLNANLQTNANAIAQVLEFSREHRRAGEANAEVANRVIAAIQGNAAAQAELGLRVRSGSTALEAQVQVMRQIGEANRAATPAAQTYSERQQQVERGFERFKSGALALVGTLTGLGGVYEGLADGSNVLSSAFEGAQARLHAWWTGAPAAAQQAAAATQQASAAEQRRGQELLRQQGVEQQAREDDLRGIRQEIELRTAQTGVESGFLTIRDQIAATQQVYNQRVTQQASLAQRYNESEKAFLQRQNEGLGQISAAQQQLLQLGQQQEQQRRARDDLGVQATTLRNLGLQISSQVRGLSVQQQYNGLLREARDLRQSEMESEAAFTQRSAATLQALAASRQAVIQQAQQAQALRDARLGLRAGLGDAISAGVMARIGLGSDRVLQLRGMSQQERDALTREAPFQLRRRTGEGDAEFLNRAAQGLAAAAQLQIRAAEGDLRLQQAEIARQAEIERVANEQNEARRAAISGNQDAFRGMRDGIGVQLAMRMREEQSLNSLRQTRGGSEGNLRSLMANLEEQSTTLLSQGGDENMRRATAIQAEAQAVANAINGYRELTQAMRESNDGARQFAIAFSGSREAAERTEFTMADFARTSRGAFDVATGAAQQHFQALIEGRETAGQAMAGFGQDLLKGLANYFVGQGIAHGAAALGAAAIGNFPGMGLELAASAGFFAAAGIAGAVGAAVAPSPPSGAAAAAASGGAPARGSDVSSRGDGAGTTIINNYNGLLTLPEAGRTMVRALDAADRQGHRPQSARS